VKSVKAQSAENNSQFHFSKLAALPSAQVCALSFRAKRGSSQLLKGSHKLVVVLSYHPSPGAYDLPPRHLRPGSSPPWGRGL